MTTAKLVQTASPFQLKALAQPCRFFRWVEEIGERVQYACGAWIHKGHDRADAIYLICRGRVGVSVGDEQAILGVGDLFGELFFDGEDGRGGYLARALEESEVWVVRGEGMRELLGDGAGRLRGVIAYKRDVLFLF